MMIVLQKLYALIFPPKCILCRKILPKDELDLCHDCRSDTPVLSGVNLKLPHLAQWTSLWYYEGNVRASILRYKFYGARSYSEAYGRLLAMKLLTDNTRFDILTWVPISNLRKWRRGYDQVELLARSVGQELGVAPQRCLKKIRHNRPQSGVGDAAARRANALGAYQCIDPACVRGKRVLLLDDVLTTGATAGECARVLLTAGAKEVICATVAVASHQRKISR
jgi:ComF family protein